LVSDKAKYRGPTRGAQGNAFKTILGIPSALGVSEPVVIESRGVRHELAVRADPGGAVAVDHRTAPCERTVGASVTVPLPALAAHKCPPGPCAAGAGFCSQARTWHRQLPVSTTWTPNPLRPQRVWSARLKAGAQSRRHYHARDLGDERRFQNATMNRSALDISIQLLSLRFLVSGNAYIWQNGLKTDHRPALSLHVTIVSPLASQHVPYRRCDPAYG
jgi:hypothetical protein